MVVSAAVALEGEQGFKPVVVLVEVVVMVPVSEDVLTFSVVAVVVGVQVGVLEQGCHC